MFGNRSRPGVVESRCGNWQDMGRDRQGTSVNQLQTFPGKTVRQDKVSVRWSIDEGEGQYRRPNFLGGLDIW